MARLFVPFNVLGRKVALSYVKHKLGSVPALFSRPVRDVVG
jgi:hypothetical protein